MIPQKQFLKFSLHYLILLFLLFGCSSHPVKPLLRFNHQLFNLTTIPVPLQNRVWLEKFTLKIVALENGNNTQELLIQTEITKTHINLVILSLDGFALAQAQWNSQTHKLEVERQIKNSLTDQLDVLKVIHDLQAAHWPLNLIKNILKPKYSVAEEIINGEKIRRFLFQNKVIIVIKKKAQRTTLKYINAGYQVETLRIQDNPLNTQSKKQ